MKIKVQDVKGNKVEDITLNDSVFKIEPNIEAVAQYIRVYMANQRQGTSSTKTRSEVSGGGKKPWKQKGTGRARHGSTRSPIWVHGGVTHGPKPKEWRLSLPKKVRALAMRSVLSNKATNKNIIVLDKIDFKKPQTKEFKNILKNLKIEKKSIIVWSKDGENIVKSAKNIERCKPVATGELNVHDIIWANKVIFTKDALQEIEGKYNK